MSKRFDHSHLHRAVSELGVKIRKEDESEPARVRSIEQWKRTADTDARKATRKALQSTADGRHDRQAHRQALW